jgi:hypothetical protein
MDNQIYDIIIIGGGISGLYTAYKIKEMNNNIKFLILEKDIKIGGRLGNYKFYGENVVTGAGVGREMDNKLIKLLKDLSIKINYFDINYDFSKKIKNPIDVIEIMEILKKNYKNEKGIFKNYAIKILGKELYKDFLISAGFQDFENSDVYDVLYNILIEDIKGGGKRVNINWEELINKLSKKVGLKNVKENIEVTKIDHLKNHFKISSKNKEYFYSKKIILATNINTIKKLLPKDKIYDSIYGQPFIRIYGKFNKESSLIMENYINKPTIVPTILQKIIPKNRENGIYMISYSDNKNAEILYKISENNEINRKKLCKIIEKSLGIKKDTLHLISIKSFFWKVGTHYYGPLNLNFKDRKEFIKEAQHPSKNILVVGEVLALEQGWTEGALNSIDNTIYDFLQD